MIKNRLYIIGNGFDLAHRIKSGYWHFKEYAQEKDHRLYNALMNYFSEEELWSDFEETLAYLDTDTIEGEASNFLVPYSAEDWSDAYHHDYQDEIDETIKLVTEKLRNHFTEWVWSVEMSTKNIVPFLSLPSDALYLTFNYTTTLQRLYAIPEYQIIHIHNKIENENSLLIIGHSRKPQAKEENDYNYENEVKDVRVYLGQKIIEEYYEETYKNTEKIISDNLSFFQALKNIEEIIILGHSLSDVDAGYFREIIKNIDLNKVTWRVSYYKQEEKMNKLNKLIGFGIEENQIFLDTIENL